MCWAPVKVENEDSVEHRGSSVFYLGENFLVKRVLELRTEGWVGVHLFVREGGG